ncbi:MAG TPA: EamA family transporter [Terriglobales bacterium]|nr:EamA family transporter [Terriglobales bacterium]
MSGTQRQLDSASAIPARWHVILAFALVYIFWGSTYLAIDVAVTQVPPALMAGTRFLIAGPLMLAWCTFRKKRVKIGRHEAIRLAVIGLLLLTCSNVVLAWAEQWVPSGLASLMVSVTPLWLLVLETWVFRGEHRVSGRALAGLGLGVFGIVVLLWPELRHSGEIGRAQLFGSLALLGASFSWALGSVCSKQWKMQVDPFTATGWEMTFAGLANILIGVAFGEQHRAVWSARGMGAILYLVIFGSWVGFTAYIWLLKHVPTPKVATYAYVNPVVAVFLGWLVLREQVTGYILAGTIVIVAAVATVTGAELHAREPAQESRLPAVESTGD